MNALSLQIPAPDVGDSPAVKEALELARSFWALGDHRQAIAWVRRAVEGADEKGDASRVATLARAVADLGTSSTRPPPPRSTVPPPLRASPPAKSALPPPPPPRSTTPPPLPSTMLPKPRVLPLRAPPQALDSVAPSSEVRRRVSVKISARDPGLLVVRPLAEGEPVPAGTREAFLVMVDPPAGAAAGSSRGSA